MAETLRGDMYDWRVASLRRALAAAGKAEGPLHVHDLTALGHLDQYHYGGADAIEKLAKTLAIGREHRVLDLGAGVGGTARVLAAQTGCHVDAVELQPELCEMATELTERCGLSKQIRIIESDVTRFASPERYDHALSLLVFLHLRDRQDALRIAFTHLRSGGVLYVEDLVLSDDADRQTHEEIARGLHAPGITTVGSYRKALQAFDWDVRLEDASDSWRDWTANRHQRFVAELDANRQLFGSARATQREQFYARVAGWFDGGELGGLIVTARK